MNLQVLYINGQTIDVAFIDSAAALKVLAELTRTNEGWAGIQEEGGGITAINRCRVMQVRLSHE